MEEAPDSEAVAEEQRRADRLRRVVDVACAVLRQGRLTPAEAAEIVDSTRAHALSLFPGKEGVFDLVLAPRFARILGELRPSPSARVLAFRARGSRA